MKPKKWWLLVTLTFVALALFLGGCVVVGAISGLALMKGSEVSKTREKLQKLSVGMSDDEVMGIMGKPYKTEAGKTGEAWFYVIEWDADGHTAADEMTPLVFEDSKLTGWGYAYLAQARRSEEIDQKQEPPQSITSGSGWVLPNGYVVTSHHVVENMGKITLISANGTRLPATVSRKDVVNDLAILEVDCPEGLPSGLPLSHKQSKVGAKVFTIGYPYPGVMGAEAKLTDGIISSITGFVDDPRVYQITVPVQPGNSGGPLLNMNGEVVGVITSKLNAIRMFQYTGNLPENVNYAVKAEYLKVLIDSRPPERVPSDELPRETNTLEVLANRIKNSVFMVIGEKE